MTLIYVLLVVIWSTGFITGKLIVGLIDPNIYLGLRFFLAGLIFLVIALAQSRTFPPIKEVPKQMLAGILLNGLYLGLSYIAISKGLPAGIMALIGALQPVLVMVLALILIKEKTSVKSLIFMLVGIAGLLLVISPLLQSQQTDFAIGNLLLACCAILCLSFGAVFQKMSVSSTDLIVSMSIQNLAASCVSALFVLLLGESLFVFEIKSILLVIWGAVILSCCGVFLMVWLLRRIKASQVSTLLLLAPPLAAIESYFLFSESMTMVQIIGFIVTLVGVYFSRKGN